MPIVPMREILKDAQNRKYAVGSYNAYDLGLVRGILKAAEQEKSPVILAHAPVHFKYTSLNSAANIIVHEAMKSKVPVALLLDHGYDIETCIEAMNLGFNAVMMDSSRLPFEENAELVRIVCGIAHGRGCDVEGEIGYVSRPVSGKDEGSDDDAMVDDKSFYTSPEDARRFVEATGVDALAVAFGTVHGVYFKKPVLDIERLVQIEKATMGVPIVMHGGSGLSAEDYKKSIEGGIRKINYYTGMAVSVAQAIKENLEKTEDKVFYHNIMMDTIDFVCEDISKSMRLFSSSNKA
ncbi:MAG: class II fructose-bisphosphate aldolase [Clostridia bacterium]